MLRGCHNKEARLSKAHRQRPHQRVATENIDQCVSLGWEGTEINKLGRGSYHWGEKKNIFWHVSSIASYHSNKWKFKFLSLDFFVKPYICVLYLFSKLFGHIWSWWGWLFGGRWDPWRSLGWVCSWRQKRISYCVDISSFHPNSKFSWSTNSFLELGYQDPTQFVCIKKGHREPPPPKKKIKKIYVWYSICLCT